MTIETDTTDTAPTTAYETDAEFAARVEAQTAKALAAVAAARAAEAAASGAVDYGRGQRARGEVEVGAVLVLQRALAAAQEETATAEAGVKTLARIHGHERDVRQRIANAKALRERADLQAIRAASQVEARRLWQIVWDSLEALDRLEGLPQHLGDGGVRGRRLGCAGPEGDGDVGLLDRGVGQDAVEAGRRHRARVDGSGGEQGCGQEADQPGRCHDRPICPGTAKADAQHGAEG